MTALLLDTYSLFFRAFHALPAMSTTRGQPTQALYGFSMLLLKLLREERPSGTALARDLPGKTFRHEAYAAYKAGRPKPPDALRAQLEQLDELFEALNFPVFSAPGFEADDVLASLARVLVEPTTTARGSALIVSGDRDLLQLVRAGVEVLFLGQRGKPAVRYDLAAVQARFGIPPERLPSYVALVGDVSDNIPKLRGIGAARARRLIAEYACIDALLGSLDALAEPRVRAALAANAAQLRESERLARLRDDVPLPAPALGKLDAPAIERTRALFEAWEFRSLIPRLLALAEPVAS